MTLGRRKHFLVTFSAVSVVAVLLALTLHAQQPKPLPGSAPCLDCHETGRRTGKRQPGVPPPFNEAALRASPHATLECTNCHSDLEGKKEFPHPAKLTAVDCGACHADEKQQYVESLHGRAAKRGDPLAPRCEDCHGTHNILRPFRSRFSHHDHPDPPFVWPLSPRRLARPAYSQHPARPDPGELYRKHPRRRLVPSGV